MSGAGVPADVPQDVVDGLSDILWRAIFGLEPVPTTAMGRKLACDRAARVLAQAGLLQPTLTLRERLRPGQAQQGGPGTGRAKAQPAARSAVGTRATTTLRGLPPRQRQG